MESVMRVFVYYNLHRRMFSVRAICGENRGRVIAHRDQIYLTNVTFKVSEAGRQRVLRELKKNVHAGCIGDWDDTIPVAFSGQWVTYNPYRYNSFVTVKDGLPVYKAAKAFLSHKTISADL